MFSGKQNNKQEETNETAKINGALKERDKALSG